MAAARQRHQLDCLWLSRQPAVACVHLFLSHSCITNRCRALVVKQHAHPAGHAHKTPGSKATSIPSPIEGGHTPSSLAFLGDAIWTVHVRIRHLLPRKHVKAYRALSDEQVTAEHQAMQCQLLLQQASQNQGDTPPALPSFQLTPQELDVLNWAMAEQPSSLRQRFRGKPQKMQQYQMATALEALVGYLHLTNPARCQQLLSTLLQ